MSQMNFRGFLKIVAFVNLPLVAASASAMGYGYGMHPSAPMSHPSAHMGMMPYGMPGPYSYGAPVSHGAGGYKPQPAAHDNRSSHQVSKAHKTSSAATAGTKVDIAQMSFEPAVIRIKKGETVTWNNRARMPHTVTAKGGDGPKSGTLRMGQSFSHTFDDAGTFEYYCAIHPSMSAKVIVN